MKFSRETERRAWHWDEVEMKKKHVFPEAQDCFLSHSYSFWAEGRKNRGSGFHSRDKMILKRRPSQEESLSSCLVSLRVISLSFTRVFTQYMTQWDSEEKRGILCFNDWEKNILLALVTKRCTLGSKRHIQSVANNDSLSFLSVSSLFHPCLLRVKENSKDCPLNHVMLLLHRWEQRREIFRVFQSFSRRIFFLLSVSISFIRQGRDLHLFFVFRVSVSSLLLSFLSRRKRCKALGIQWRWWWCFVLFGSSTIRKNIEFIDWSRECKIFTLTELVMCF